MSVVSLDFLWRTASLLPPLLGSALSVQTTRDVSPKFVSERECFNQHRGGSTRGPDETSAQSHCAASASYLDSLITNLRDDLEVTVPPGLFSKDCPGGGHWTLAHLQRPITPTFGRCAMDTSAAHGRKFTSSRPLIVLAHQQGRGEGLETLVEKRKAPDLQTSCATTHADLVEAWRLVCCTNLLPECLLWKSCHDEGVQETGEVSLGWLLCPFEAQPSVSCFLPSQHAEASLRHGGREDSGLCGSPSDGCYVELHRECGAREGVQTPCRLSRLFDTRTFRISFHLFCGRGRRSLGLLRDCQARHIISGSLQVGIPAAVIRRSIPLVGRASQMRSE